jgi:hypothetical protein
MIDKQDGHKVGSIEIDEDQNTLTAIRHCIPVLEQIVERSELLAKLSENDRVALLSAAGRIARPGSEEIRKRKKDKKQLKRRASVEKEKRLRAATGIRKAREASVFTAPLKISGPVSVTEETGQMLESPRNCYVCKAAFKQIHHFYDAMCPECAEFNYQKRFQTASLKGQVALITGSRLKIGYQGRGKGDCHDPVSQGFRPPVFKGKGFFRLGSQAPDLRSGSEAYPECGAVL